MRVQPLIDAKIRALDKIQFYDLASAAGVRIPVMLRPREAIKPTPQWGVFSWLSPQKACLDEYVLKYTPSVCCGLGGETQID
jgi:hypothetical protein